MEYIQSATSAAFVALNIPDATIPGLRATWQGNRLNRGLFKDDESNLVVRALAGQQAVRQEVSLRSGASSGEIVVLPMIVQNQAVGSLTLVWDGSPPAGFDLRSTQVLTNAIGLALESARAAQSQQYYIQALEYLGGLPTELNVLTSSSEVMTRTKHIACALLNVERAVIFLTSENIVTELSESGLSENFIASLKGADLSGWPFSQGADATVVFASAEAIPEGSVWRDVFQKERIYSGIMILLQGHLRALGCIAVYYDRPYTPTLYEIRLLEILAAQLAVAIDNLELNIANEQHAEMLEAHVAERTRELAIALDKAEDADRLKTQLLSTVSHELRTPLSVIKANATMTIAYYDRLTRERQMYYLQMINEETDRLTSLITNLLDMSRLEAGRLEIRCRSIEPALLLADLIGVIQSRFSDREFQWAIPSSLPPVFADPERTRQVVENLVDNAVKYSPANTPIEVGARAWDDALEIWVKDQGSGLHPDQARRVFERFYQINGGQTARSGVGLGLAICKALVEEMKGRIWCESAGLNKGSKFAFTLPWTTRNG